MRRRRRLVDGDDDILDGVANFFDLGLIFGLGFMLALMASAGVSAVSAPTPSVSAATRARAADAGADEAAAAGADSSVPRESRPLPRYRLGKARSAGDGVRLGTAYRLSSGEVVCVPEGEAPR